MRVFLSTPLEDSRRLHLRHLARGINYRDGFTPVTILPDHYPPSIRIKAGEGGAFQGSIPRGARTPRASRNTSTSCSPLLRLSSPSLLPPFATRHYHDLCKFCVNCWHYAPSYRLAFIPSPLPLLQPIPRILPRQFRGRRD